MTVAHFAALVTHGSVFFFDSHGGLWETCAPSAPGAEAFGPKVTARPVAGQPTYGEFLAAGLVAVDRDGDGWDYVRPTAPNPYRGREYDADRAFYAFCPHMAPHLFE